MQRDKTDIQQMHREHIERLQRELQQHVTNRLVEMRQLADNIGNDSKTTAVEQLVCLSCD